MSWSRPRGCCTIWPGISAGDDAGARVLRLLLFRVDGDVLSLDLGLAAPSRDPEHIARLIGLRLDRLGGGLDADFGFEAAAVHVLVAEPLAARQVALGMSRRRGRARRPRPVDRPAAATPRSRCRAPAPPLQKPYSGACRAGPRCRVGQFLAPMPGWMRPRPMLPTAPRPLLLLPRPEDGGGGGAHPGRSAAAIPLARRDASGGRCRGAGAHHARMVAPHRRSRARLLRRRGYRRAPLLALPRRPLRQRCGASPMVRAWAVRMTAFAELIAATNFSFLRGASHPHEMVGQAAELKLAAIGIADRNTLAGVVRAHTAAKEAGIRLARRRASHHHRRLRSGLLPDRPGRVRPLVPPADAGQSARAQGPVPFQLRGDRRRRRGPDLHRRSAPADRAGLHGTSWASWQLQLAAVSISPPLSAIAAMSAGASGNSGNSPSRPALRSLPPTMRSITIPRASRSPMC